MPASSLTLPLAATAIAIASAAAGAALTARPQLTRVLIPLSGCFLLGVAVFGLMPELAHEIGLALALLLAMAGYGLLTVLDRSAFPVCASCDHGKIMRGFVTPLLLATAIHAFVDGWGLMAIQVAAPQAANAVAAAILLHKVPEGLALGTILRASFGRTGQALPWCAAAEAATLAGGAAGWWLTPPEWVAWPLAVAAGTFLFMGVSAIRSGWKWSSE